MGSLLGHILSVAVIGVCLFSGASKLNVSLLHNRGMLILDHEILRDQQVLFPGLVLAKHGVSPASALPQAYNNVYKAAMASGQDAYRWYSVGQVATFAGRRTEAREAYLRATTNGNEKTMAPLALGVLLLSEGSTEKAMATWDKSPETTASGLYWLGTYFRTTREWERAVNYYTLSAQLTGNLEHKARAYRNIADIELYFLRNLDAALHFADQAVRTEPSDIDGHTLKILILAEKGAVSSAVREAEALAKERPNSSEAFLALGTVYNRGNHQPLAENAWRRSLQLQETSTWAHYSLGRLLWDTGRKAEAYPHFCRALELTPGFLFAPQILPLVAGHCR